MSDSVWRFLREGLVVVAWLAAVPCALAGELRVAVAANFAAPMHKLSSAFERATGHTVRVSFGSTGKFYSQIKAGAPFDVLLAADDETPARLVREGDGVAGTSFTYAVGRLALWSATPGFVDAQGEVLRKGQYSRLAIANPRLAPYGLAAEEVLQFLGLRKDAEARFVTGESIAQAYQFVVTGNAELGFVALSQVMQDGAIKSGSAWVVPARMHRPIRQDAVMLTGAQDRSIAGQWLQWLRSEEARAVIQGFGYESAAPP